MTSQSHQVKKPNLKSGKQWRQRIFCEESFIDRAFLVLEILMVEL